MMEDSVRPWGFYEILADTDSHKVKRITVLPGKRLSLQRHLKRSEHWFVVSGSAVVTCGPRDVAVAPGGYVDIPRGEDHRIRNDGDENLVFIEIQTGSYFGEDDIIRLEDDFGRK
ncbi:MAG: phosphomannose isomerase type II C-terminal cupin domain [Spirochaetes bacterium]|nr:phosphomannose isomerase type II C-terminal cupin domain [Spirochaetota bacterium]